MVSDVDIDNDGEVSFEEFQSKVQSVLKEQTLPGSPGGDQDSHWHSLSRLISQFSEVRVCEERKTRKGSSLLEASI